MRHEAMHPRAAGPDSGGVLDSIRRLVALDQAGRHGPEPASDAAPAAKRPARSGTAAAEPEPGAEAARPFADSRDPAGSGTARPSVKDKPFGRLLLQTGGRQRPARVAGRAASAANRTGPDDRTAGTAMAPTGQPPADPLPGIAAGGPVPPQPRIPAAGPISAPQAQEGATHPVPAAAPPAALSGEQVAEPLPGNGAAPRLFAPPDQSMPRGAHLRGMIREAIRQELRAEIGNRLGRDLQELIRLEIALALREMCEEQG